MQPIESGYLVNGNVLSVGNGSLWCDPDIVDPEVPSNLLCADLHSGSEPNNVVMMVNRDTDSDATTFNSTSAAVKVPDGASVAKAWLFWSANGYGPTQDSDVAQCDGGNLRDPNTNSPAERHVPMADVAAQQPLIRVDNGTYQRVPVADHTSIYTPPQATHEQRIHAAVDVSDILREDLADGSHTITVADLLGSEGYSCSAGWVLHLSYDYGAYVPGNPDSESRRIYTDFGLDRVIRNVRSSTFDGFKTVAPGATFLVSTTEGDSSSAATGFDYNRDTAEVTWAGGSDDVANAKGDTVNVFRSLAQGNLSYFPSVTDSAFFNGSVDTFTFTASGLPPGTTALDFTYRSTADEGYFPQALTVAVPVASVDIDKTAGSGDDHQFVAIGERPRYEITLTNTSSVALANVTFLDPLAEACTVDGSPLPKSGDTFSAPNLGVGESTVVECEGPPVQENDPKFVNTATVQATDPNGDPVPEAADDSKVYPVGVNLEKTAEPLVVPMGDEVTWSMAVTNTGGSELSEVALTDEDCAGAVSAPSGPGAPASLAPGNTWTYTCTEPLAAGKTNTASVTAVPTGEDPITGLPVTGDPVRDEDDAAAQVAGFTIVKSTNSQDANQTPGPEVEVGAAVTWTYVVRNTGEVPVHDIAVTDDQGVVVPAVPSSGDTDGDGVLGVGESWTFEATGTATRGQYRNVGTVTGTYDDDNEPGSPRVALDPETDPSHYLGLDSGLMLDKLVASVTDVDDNGLTDAGDEIRWEFELTNTGDVTLTDVRVDDPLAGSVTCPAAPLAPGDSVTCSADAAYVITQADVDAGSVVNVATATGEKPNGDPNDPADDVPSNEDETETPTDQTNGLVLDKRVAKVEDVNRNELTDAGDEITWEFELTNAGTVTLTDLQVEDPLAGSVSCPTAPLPARESVVCTADNPYVITQADVDAGSVVNVASATGEKPNGDPTDPADDVPSNEDETETPTDRTPSLSLDKRVAEVTDVNANGRTDAGDKITWEFELTNTGTVTLTHLQVNDPLVAAAGIAIACPTASLPPGAAVMCQTELGYSITAADVRRGQVLNVATAVGETPNGDPTDPSDDVPSNEDQTRTPIPEASGGNPDNNPGGALPNTGGPSTWWLAVGLLLVLAGAGVVVDWRRLRMPWTRA